MRDRSSLSLRLTTAAIERLFQFQPFFARATAKARKKIIDRADTLGVRWEERVEEMRCSMDQLEQQYESLFDKQVRSASGKCMCSIHHGCPVTVVQVAGVRNTSSSCRAVYLDYQMAEEQP